jgi:hypothetical protein
MCTNIRHRPSGIWLGELPVCVSLFYVIDTGSIRPRARIPGEPNWGLPIFPSLLAQTLAVPIYPYPYWVPQSTSGLWWNLGHGLLRSKTETDQAALPGQDHMYPFGVIGVAPWYIPVLQKIFRVQLQPGTPTRLAGVPVHSLAGWHPQKVYLK